MKIVNKKAAERAATLSTANESKILDSLRLSYKIGKMKRPFEALKTKLTAIYYFLKLKKETQRLIEIQLQRLNEARL